MFIIYDKIKKVVFPKLSDKSYDRRGEIAVFHIEDIPNKEFAGEIGVQVVQLISSLLKSGYESVLGGEIGDQEEQNESWIRNYYYRDRTVVLSHKYWSEAQVKAFKDIVKAIAPLHGWGVEEEN